MRLTYYWILGIALTFSAGGAYALTCSDVNGAYVYSADGTYLGFFGSQFASDSINNTFGSYGSQFSSYSTNNQFASVSTVPRLYKYGNLIGYVPTNSLISGGVSLSALLWSTIWSTVTSKPYRPRNLEFSQTFN